MLLAVLHFVPDEEHPEQVVAAPMDARRRAATWPSLAATNDIGTERMVTRAAARLQHPAGRGPDPPPDARGDVPRYFAGLDLIEPGLVPIQQWRAPFDPEAVISAYGGVARKP